MKASTTTDKSGAASTLIVPRPRSEMVGLTRRILHFLLAPQTLWMLVLLPLSLVLYQVAVQFEAPLGTVLRQQLPLLVLLFAATLGLILSGRLRLRLDRLFFQPQHQQEHMLASLLEQIANFDELAEAIYYSCQRINEAYQSTPIHFFFRPADTRDLKLVYSYGAATEIILIPEEARLRALLKREGQPLEYPFVPGVFLPPTEQNWLERLQARLLVPMTGKDHRLLGLITLGEKRSAPGYNPQDCLLLAALGEHLARRMEREEQRHQMQEQAKAPLATLARLEAEMVRQKQPAAALKASPLPAPAAGDNTSTDEKPQWI